MTAVNWMIEKLIERHSGKVGKEYIKIFEQAKEMEKQQMMDCYLKADIFPRKYEFESYYNKTYGSKGSDETKTN